MLTDVAIENLKAQLSRREYPDGKIAGLYVVVQPTGAKSFALRYRVAGVPRKLTIGPYPAIGLKTARKKAQEALGDVAGGNDPAGEKRAAREAQKAANATLDRVENVVDEFVQKHLAKKTKPSWAKEAERLLRVEIIPTFGRKRLGEVTRVEVRRLLEDIAERAPTTARLTHAVFRKLCNWAVSREMITVSPCAGIEAPTHAPSRERVLADSELRVDMGCIRDDRLALRADLQALGPDWRETGRSRFDALGRDRS